MSIAKLFGYCLGDGWLSRTKQTYHDSYCYQMGFSGSKESLETVIKPELEYIFGNIGKATISTSKTESPKYGISGTTSKFVVNARAAKHFLSLGMPYGKLVEVDYKIPSWIMNGSAQTKIDFLSGFYSAEGRIPSFQKNNITMKALEFSFYKRKSKEANKDLLVSQWSQILSDLDISFSYSERIVRTVEDNFVCVFVFCNEHNQVIKQLSLLDLSYCLEKEKARVDILNYYLKKDKAIRHSESAYEYMMSHPDVSPTEIGKMFDIDRSTLYTWRRKKPKFSIPKNFPNFDEYLSLQQVIAVE